MGDKWDVLSGKHAKNDGNAPFLGRLTKFGLGHGFSGYFDITRDRLQINGMIQFINH